MQPAITINRRFRTDDVRQALSGTAVQSISVTKVKGSGRRKGRSELHRGADYVVQYPLMVPLVIHGLLPVPVRNGGVNFSAQLIGAATVFGWLFAVSDGAWLLLKMIMGERVSAMEEYEGADIVESGL